LIDIKHVPVVWWTEFQTFTVFGYILFHKRTFFVVLYYCIILLIVAGLLGNVMDVNSGEWTGKMAGLGAGIGRKRISHMI
jgi:lipoprotein signal peptidase